MIPEKLPGDADGPAARAYLKRHDDRAQLVDALSLRRLRGLWQTDMALAGLVSLLGGPQDHDELVNYILGMEFPDAARARQVHSDWVLNHTPAIGQE